MENENTEHFQQEVAAKLEEQLEPFEQILSEKAERIIDKLNEKTVQLQEWEARLKAKQEELQALQGKIEACEAKMQALDDAERHIQSLSDILLEREKNLQTIAEQHTADYKKHFEELDRAYKEKAEQQAAKLEAYHKDVEALVQRETAVAEAERILEAELNQKRSEAEAALLEQKRQKMEDLQQWTAEQQTQFSSTLEKKYQQELERCQELQEEAIQQANESLENERKTKREALEKELASMKAEAQSSIEAQQKEAAEKQTAAQAKLEAQAKELQERDERLTKREEELNAKDRTLRREMRRVETRDGDLDEREENLDDEVESRFASRIAILQSEISTKDQTNQQLEGSLKKLQQENQELQAIKANFGDEPFTVINGKLKDLIEENQKLKDRVQELPSAADKEALDRAREQLDRMQEENANLLRENDSMRSDSNLAKKLKGDYDTAIMEKSILENRLKIADNTRQRLQEELDRLTQPAEQASERQARIDTIENAQIEGIKAPLDVETPPQVDEIEWLENIGRNCYDYGFKFPKRILYAFHTALKIADWSTITVLAGVSGTGKSELPHLYAAFGGLNFIAVPVQPNWDSQESMLGFFNSIDNKFDAQPLLRFLAQCSAKRDNMENSVNIVLLDEMNLAHVEHYFAEFLSKLELRRDTGYGDEPYVNINIGAGMEPYRLQLTRNILWTGTMNQDETTKSLSDKVLDRGLVINFPRPKQLISRTKLTKLEDFVADRDIPMLDYRVWSQQWVKTELPFSEEQQKHIDDYRQMIEEINNYLAEAGRALGHRVWQSIEFYAANYPLVDAALKTADGEVTPEFRKAVKNAVEDQLVQKAMPKLRGIETRGQTRTNCLDKIRVLLEKKGFNLDEDFRRACELGYGQFMWNSAEYINADKKIAGAPDQVESN